jgi:hypothetical protein
VNLAHLCFLMLAGLKVELPVNQSFLETAGFEVLQHYYRPADKPRHEQPWLAIVSRAVTREPTTIHQSGGTHVTSASKG